MLEKALTLTDLTLFGVASIIGSGGFNLVGKAIRAGGAWWPVAFGISAALLLGASYAYSDAFQRFGKNTTESDMVASIFGPMGEGVSVAAILLFNIVSISAILVFCTQMMIPIWVQFYNVTPADLFCLGGVRFQHEVCGRGKRAIRYPNILLYIECDIHRLGGRSCDGDSCVVT
jgi:amino acid transporter